MPYYYQLGLEAALIILVLAMFQYFYMGVIKTKRPALVST